MLEDTASVSADGRFVVRDSSRRPLVQSLAGDEPHPILGVSPMERTGGWSSDGRLYTYGESVPRTRVSLVDPVTGRREAWREIGPSDATGAWPIDGFSATPDGSAYVYCFARRLSDLYLVEGLR
jgi:hypothetical protein